MKKTGYIGIVAILLVGLISATAFALPFGNGYGSEKDSDVIAAIEEGDYDSFLEAAEESDRPFMAQHMTEERFNERVERFQEMQAFREEMETAMDQGYDAWYAFITSADRPHPFVDQITEENFDTFVAMHEAREAGDFETAQTLAESLGIERGFGQGKQFNKGQGRGMDHGNCQGFGNTN